MDTDPTEPSRFLGKVVDHLDSLITPNTMTIRPWGGPGENEWGGGTKRKN